MSATHLVKTINEIAAPIDRPLNEVKNRVENELKSLDLFTDQIGTYLTKMQGKYFRALLVLLTAQTLKQDEAKSISIAQCVETLHFASLIHDDVLDDSALRRGQKTVQNIWGNHVAILVGDYLYTRTTQIMIEFKNQEILEHMAQITMGLTQGELLQLSLRNRLDITLEDYFKVLSLKTAKFMGVCALFGGVLVNLNEQQKKALENFGYYLGMAFQISDDLMDWTAQINEPLKPVQHDLMEGTISLPLLLTIQKMTADEKQQLQNYLEHKEPSLNSYAFTLIQKYNGLKAAQEILEDFGEKANEVLKEYGWQGPLSDLVSFIIGRIKI